jgi:hypothetical protein
MDPNILTAIIAASIAVLLLANQFKEGHPYYSNGGRAAYVKFVVQE